MNKILLIIAFLLTTQSAYAATLTKAPNNLGLVGYWSFNEGTGLKVGDFSGYGNHGTLTGGPTWASGKFGKALSFDGTDDYVTCSTSGRNTTLPKTITAWAKFNSLADYDYIANFSAYSGDDIINLAREQTTGRVYYVNNGAPVFGPVLPSNTWLHLVIVFESATSVKFYLNGESQSITQPTAFVPHASPACEIGYIDVGSPLHYMNGQIDELRLYDRALGGNEVARLYGMGQTKNTSSNSNGLVGYWSFNDCRGLKATDFSGYGNHGTLTGGPSWVAGRLGCGIFFDGVNDLISLPISNPSYPLTISFWAKPSTATPIGMFDSAPGTTNVLRNYAGGAVEWWGGDPSVSLGLSAGAWAHLTFVVTYDGTRHISYYKNGILQTAATGSSISTLGWTTFTLGGINGGTDGRYSGTLDEFRIYDRALGAAEVKSLYESGVSLVNATQKNLLTSGLVGYWSFNGQDTSWSSATAGTTRDVSGQGNTGTMTNMSQGDSPVAGKSGQALAFDGVNDYVDTPSVSTYSFGTGDFTVSFWMKTTDTTGNILSRGPTTAAVGDWALVLFSSDLYWQSRHGVTNLYSRSATSILDGSWHHVVVRRSGTTNTMYFDNVQQGVSVTDTTDYSPTNILRMGDGANGFFGGSLDDVRIYNRALSDAEVKQLYYLGK